MRAIVLAVAFGVVGCAAQPVDDEGPTTSEEQALDVLAPVTELALEVAGQPAGAVRSLRGNPKIGEATATFNISESLALLDWLQGVSSKDVAVVGYDAKGTRRRIDYTRSVIKEISFPPLDAKDGKKHLEVTVKFKPEEIKYSSGGGKLQKPVAPASPRVQLPGVDSRYVTKITLPKLTPKIAQEAHGRYAPVRTSPLALEVTPELAKKVLGDGLVSEAEYIDILIDLVGPTGTTVGSLSFHAPKKGAKSSTKAGAAVSTLEFMVEEFEFHVKH
jgi:hypothetical protein